MSEYRETRTIFEDKPIRRARPVEPVPVEPVVDTQYETVVHEHRGMSGGEVAALVLAALAAGVVITMLILNSQQQSKDEELARQRTRDLAAEQANAQPAPQPPVIVMPSQPQPGVAPVTPVPVPSQTVPATAPTNTELEVEVGLKLRDDPDLRAHSINVKVSGGTAMLSGTVTSDELKTRAEDVAKTIKGIRTVINGIVVKPE